MKEIMKEKMSKRGEEVWDKIKEMFLRGEWDHIQETDIEKWKKIDNKDK